MIRLLQDSEFIRLHQDIATATFQTKSSDLYLSYSFLNFLNGLPLNYNYALYRQIFQQFGTHYFRSGTLGGRYDLLYQFDRETLKTKGIGHTGMAEILYTTECFMLEIRSNYIPFVSGFTEEQKHSSMQNMFNLNLFIYSTGSSKNTQDGTTDTTNYEGNDLITYVCALLLYFCMHNASYRDLPQDHL